MDLVARPGWRAAWRKLPPGADAACWGPPTDWGAGVICLGEVEGSVEGGGCLFLAVGQLEISTTHGERPLCHCY